MKLSRFTMEKCCWIADLQLATIIIFILEFIISILKIIAFFIPDKVNLNNLGFEPEIDIINIGVSGMGLYGIYKNKALALTPYIFFKIFDICFIIIQSILSAIDNKTFPEMPLDMVPIYIIVAVILAYFTLVVFSLYKKKMNENCTKSNECNNCNICKATNEAQPA